MRVGVNYPWLDYGWDFGLGPARWRGARTAPRWLERIDDDLDRLHGLGVDVVRWFILADGLTYGTDDRAPRPEPAQGSWRFDPPALDQEVIDHFDELLRRFARIGAPGAAAMQLLPVLIDFQFCWPGVRPVEEDDGWVKRGRADAILDAEKRSRFLGAALEPFLEVSARQRDVIYAWELINEPDWITAGWHRSPIASTPIPRRAMVEFLEDGAQRIRSAGFKSTIGFASARTLRRSAVAADVDQFHYYPDGKTPLGSHAVDAQGPRIIGEFATSTDDVWPGLGPTSQDVAYRLRLAASRGYELAIPWSLHAVDRHTDWSAAVEEDIRAFTSTTTGRS